MLNIVLAGWLVVVVLLATAADGASVGTGGRGQCVSVEDCSFNGHCGRNGTCECLPGWRNPACGVLDVLPSPYAAGYHNASFASWGGNALFDPIDGLWHMFVAEMANHCPLNDWGQNSQIIRSTSPTAEGPYTFAQVVIRPFAHNPTVRRLPNNAGYVLYMIGGTPSAPANCTSSPDGLTKGSGDWHATRTSDDGASGSIRVSFSHQLAGPWSAPQVVLFSNVNASSYIGCGYTNPSPFVFENGTVLLAFQGGPCVNPSPFSYEMLGVAIAPSWNASYVVINDGQPIVTPDWYCVAGFGEDPFVWYSPATDSFHMLAHGMCFAPFDARHLYSTDGSHWTVSSIMPYSYEVNYTDHAAEIYWRVERPQLLFDPARPYGDRPIALVNGVCGDGLECLNTPMMTWTLLRSLQ